MHVRMNMLVGDPARLDDATRYIEGTRPHIEALHGNRGVACAINADLGVCIIASYWDTLDAMTASEQEIQVTRKEVTELLRGTVTVEHYEVPVFVRRSRPRGGAGVRLARFECPPGSMDTLIEEFRNTGVPALMDIPGLCSAHMMTDRTTGRCIAITAWENMDAMAASRSATAGPASPPGGGLATARAPSSSPPARSSAAPSSSARPAPPAVARGRHRR